MPADALTCEAVSKRFGRTLALDAIDLRVGAGECFGLVGMNGAGKTTLIRCLLDANRADAGTLAIFGTDSRLTAARRLLAFLPERFSAPFYATGADFLRLMARLYRSTWSRDQAERQVALLGLDPAALARPVRGLSKGMTQKLGLAACLLAGRPLLVLDEPASGLDPVARARLKTALRDRRDAGDTVFFTSHSLADIDEMCDRMAILHHGRVQFVGTPARLRELHHAVSLEDAFLACIEESAQAASPRG